MLFMPTTWYGPPPTIVSPLAQPRTLAPARIRPLRDGPLHWRASFCRRSWVAAVRSFRALMMFSIICMLAPTHCTRFFCAT
jgi:hypothetical protein